MPASAYDLMADGLCYNLNGDGTVTVTSGGNYADAVIIPESVTYDGTSLPAAGDRWDSDLDYAGTYGFYWSRTLHSSYPYYAYGLDFNSDDVDWDYYDRGYGLSVRAVRVPQN